MTIAPNKSDVDRYVEHIQDDSIIEHSFNKAINKYTIFVIGVLIKTFRFDTVLEAAAHLSSMKDCPDEERDGISRIYYSQLRFTGCGFGYEIDQIKIRDVENMTEEEDQELIRKIYKVGKKHGKNLIKGFQQALITNIYRK